MRKIYLFLLTVFSILATQGLFAQTVTIGSGTSTARYPLAYYYGYARSSAIYTATEMGTSATNASVVSIAYYTNTATNTGPTVVYLKEVGSSTTQTAATWATKITGAVQVYSGTPAIGSAGAWRTITLPVPFPITAGQNLEVLVECNYGGEGATPIVSAGNAIRYSSVTNGHQFWETDNSPPAGNGTVNGNRPNIQMVLGPPILCVPGSLAGGTAQSSAANACSGVNFTLSVTGASFGAGLTYQWESSSDDLIWTPINLATSSTLTTSQTATTYYRRKMTCSGTDAWSAPVQVTMSSFLNCYCASSANSTSFEYIGGVVVAGTGGFSNTGTNHSTYTNYSATRMMTKYQGEQVTLTISSGGTWYGTDAAYVFIDYNQDGDFADANELVGSGTGATSPYTINFTIPSSATLGLTRMRVKFGDRDATLTTPMNNSPCQAAYSYGETEDYAVTITVPPPCSPPTGLSVAGITTTTATLNWNASTTTPAGGYEWEIRSSGAAGSGAAGLAASGSTAAGVLTANATGLSADVAYTLYVRAVCTAGSLYSAWSSGYEFRTLCTAIGVPYLQNFESVTAPAIPSCTSVLDVNGGTTWATVAVANPGWGFPGNALRYLFNTSLPGNDWFFLRGLNLTGGTIYQITFKYGTTDPGYPEKLKIAYGTSPVPASMTTTIADYPNIIANSSAPYANEVIVPFTPAVTGVYYIGFQAYSAADQFQLFLDDILVELQPTCPLPTAVKAVGISPTAVQVSFTSPGNAFIVEYGAPGFTPGTGNTAGTGGTLAFGAASPITVSSLAANTTYDFYVRRVCIPGVDYSGNVKVTASTLCAAVNVPYTQNFDGAVTPAIPSCTSSQDLNGNSGTFWNDGTGGAWETYSDTDPATAVSLPTSLLYMYDGANTTRPADDWFYTQGLNLTAGTSYRLTFYYKAADGANYPEKLEVKYGNAAIASSMTNTLFNNANISTTLDNPFDSVRVDFTPAATGIYYVGFHAYSDADMFAILVDNINVKVTPVVDAGVTAVTGNPTCPGSAALQATIRNYNLSTLNFATYPVTVTATLSGASTGSVSATINTGTLAPGATMTVNLPAFTFVSGTYSINVKTVSTSDLETANDAITASVYVNPTPAVATVTPAAPAICAGSTVQLSTQFVTPAPAPVTMPAVSSGAITVAIPDNAPAGGNHSLTVSGIPANATVTGVSVTMNVAHNWVNDVIANLKAPNGKVLNLFNQHGGTLGANLTNTVVSSASTTAFPATGAPFTGTYAADAVIGVGPSGFISDANSFTDLFTGSGNGAWTLALRDNEALIGGTLTSWSITITYAVIYPKVTWTPITGLYTNSAASTAYAAGADAYSVYAKPAATTTYTVTTTSAAGCTSTNTVTVTVNPNPVVAINALPNRICISDSLVPLTATPVGGTWSGIGISGNTFVPPVTAVGTYTLSYSYTNNFGCTTVGTTTAKVEECPERVILLRDNAVILFPNPNNGQFNIRINSTLYNKLTMRVYTGSGSVVRTQQFNGLIFGRVVPIDLRSLPGGTYMVQFSYDGGVRTSEKTFKVVVGR